MPSAGSATDGGGLRVAFDVTPVITGRTGIARYVTELGAALEREDVELRRFAIGRSTFALPPGSRHLRVPARVVMRWWRIVPWPTAERLVGGADVVHATGSPPPATRLPLVVTVHDVAALRYPDLHPARHVHQQRGQLATLERAGAIVTVSATTADDLVQLGIPQDRIVVAPLGLTPLPDPAPPAATPLDGEYLLTVGETSPRKRYHVLLEAMSRLRGGPRLVMVGPPAGDEERLRALILELGLTQRVTRLGAVSDAELSWLYRHATALCFPSISEGFGLPVLEALAAGVPVIASDIAATRELASSIAVYPGSEDADDWAQAIEAVASDTALRERIGRDGSRRAAQFTWERTAAATLDAYRMALAGRA
jgi:glycosyltransferase involved in cell wall biosynthesis